MLEYKYKLDGHNVIKCSDLMEWAVWLETADRKVALTYINPDIKVSTFFLCINHNFGEGPPLLFETMVFGGKLDEHQRRYSTWDEAEKGHKEVVENVKRMLGKYRSEEK